VGHCSYVVRGTLTFESRPVPGDQDPP
jgi:hypothetical protein